MKQEQIIKINTFLEHIYTIADAAEQIIEIDEGKIVNEVGLKSYPFHLSLDEMHSEILAWAEAIEDTLEGGQNDRQPA